MTVYGFTGTRSLTLEQESLIGKTLDGLGDVSGVVTGAAIGVDSFVGRYAYKHWYVNVNHIVVVPADRSRVDAWWETSEFKRAEERKEGWFDRVPAGLTLYPLEVIEMPEGTTYKDRNQAIVDRCDKLIGFPEYPEDHPKSRRSGTWQTIRMGQRAGKVEKIVYLREQ